MTELTAAQQSAIDLLVTRRRIERVPHDGARCLQFLEQAEIRLSDIRHLRHPQNRYNLAYDAAHDVGEALLAGYGYRTRNGPGQHDALVQFLASVFDEPPAKGAARHVEQMRRERNQQRYHAKPPTEASAEVADKTATVLLEGARSRVAR